MFSSTPSFTKLCSITNLGLMVFLQETISRIKDGAYVINLDDKKRKGKVSLFIERNTAVYFDSFGIEKIPQEV